jgi:hypothetical protein
MAIYNVDTALKAQTLFITNVKLIVFSDQKDFLSIFEKAKAN